jgi:hypothetical protein
MLNCLVKPLQNSLDIIYKDVDFLLRLYGKDVDGRHQVHIDFYFLGEGALGMETYV